MDFDKDKKARAARYDGRAGKWRLLLLILAVIVAVAVLFTATACDKNGGNPYNDSTEEQGDAPSDEEPNGNGDDNGGDDTDTPDEPADSLKDFETIIFSSKQYVYDGQPHTLVAEGYPSGTIVSYSVDGNDGATFTDAGVYLVSARFVKSGYKPLTLTATLTITPLTLTAKFEDVTVVWDGQAHSVYAEIDAPSECVTYEGNGQTEVGEYTVRAHFELSKNYTPIADMTAKLTITERYYSVRFHHIDGQIEEFSVRRGDSFTAIPEPHQRPGFEVGWMDADLSNIQGDVDVYTKVLDTYTYTVQYVLNGGINEQHNVTPETPSMYTYTMDDEPLTLADPIYNGHEFLGWYDEDGDRVTVIPDEKGPRDMVLTAKWYPDPPAEQNIAANKQSPCLSFFPTAAHADILLALPLPRREVAYIPPAL